MIIRGEVVAGRSLGRTLGFPTANISLENGLVVENGVYFSRVAIDGAHYVAVSNVGVKPTVGGRVKALESFILDFTGDLYGKFIEVELVKKLRDERCFESVELLQKQIALDVEIVKNLK